MKLTHSAWVPVLLSALSTPAWGGEVELILSYQSRPYEKIEPIGETRFLSPDSLLCLEGLKLEWSAGETVEIAGKPVLMDTRSRQMHLRLESDSLKIRFGEVEGPPQRGKFAIDAPFLLSGDGIRLKLLDGRYSFAEGEMRLAMSGASWRQGLGGFLMAGLIGLVTLVMLINARRTRRRLEEERGSVGRRR